MFLRYLLVSAGALAVDLAVLALSVRMLPYSPALAAAIGYLTGALAHYRLSRRNVFPAGWMAGAPLAEFGAFVASVLIDRLRNSDRGGEATATRIVLPTELVVRASCGQQSRFAAAQRQPDARDSNTRHIKGGMPQPEPVHG